MPIKSSYWVKHVTLHELLLYILFFFLLCLNQQVTRKRPSPSKNTAPGISAVKIAKTGDKSKPARTQHLPHEVKVGLITLHHLSIRIYDAVRLLCGMQNDQWEIMEILIFWHFFL